MITNERQYSITNSEVQKLQTLLQSSIDTADIHPMILQAQKTAIQSQIKELSTQLEEYKNLKEGRIKVSEVSSLSDLPLLLIKARIASAFTQAELAEKLQIKEQQVQRYESDRYMSASLKTLLKIADILGLKIVGEAKLAIDKDNEDISSVDPVVVKEMFARGWFEGFDGTLKQALENSQEILSYFFESAGIRPGSLAAAMHKQNIRTGSRVNMSALKAWHARILIKASNLKNVGFFDRSLINEAWLKNLASLSAEENGPLKAQEYLLNHGIRFVVEPHLQGTHLDGACMLLNGTSPVIAMTLRRDRLDNFWFVLFHEIAHLILHVNEETKLEFFDDIESEHDGLEKEADNFSLNAMISPELWEMSVARYTSTKTAILKEAKSWSVHPAIIAGRIRMETGKYNLLSDLIGNGQVRHLFSYNPYQ